jgi:hypothetical protein
MRRGARGAVAGLAVAAVVLVAAVIVLLDQAGTPSPTASPIGATSPAPSPSPSIESTPAPSPASDVSPTPAASPRPSPSPVPSPSPILTGSPTGGLPAVEREVRIVGLGLDRPGIDEAAERYVTFDVDGPTTFSLALLEISAGQALVCTWRGTIAEVADRQCQRLRRGTIDRQVEEAGPSTWTVSLIGADAQVSPAVTLQLGFSAGVGRLTLERLRFQGQAIDNYNGTTLELMPAAGTMAVAGEIDDGLGGQYPYALRLEPLSGQVGAGPIEESGHGGRFEHRFNVGGEQPLRLTVENSLVVADEQVLLRVEISWP